ncbi:protein transport protein Sec31A-like isoform X2 [Gigantopelta aegis]|uniref:protein transport protein Sec31A-like isoform X2 n=1 Tax=Gigantopelta aegis TaxID=1735272 RepID=UPI001B88A2B2|nr:protein transport protein Sec31A-like isoform X2 [Gigantopelta aegis]
MRIKEIDRTANLAWSPATQYPIYLVTGTAAQQLDATFSTSSALEVYGLNLAEATLDMPMLASMPSDCRFHKVLWGSHGIGGKETPSGLIVAGTDNGSIQVYDAASMLSSKKDCLVFEKSQHTGAVKALDFNPFQPNLLASGGSESEILIWDMTKPDTPMTPGQKSQPPEEVACVSWNRQVQHILASTFTARCVVWDLRKNEPIIKISDSMSRIKAKTVAWHPDVATQLCISSEDDHTPVIQLWDLRYATSPLKVLESHQKGILSMAWCPQDADLLMTCGKDNRILCWNPNSNVPGGEVVYELPTSNQWCFDVQWCPRNPSIISSSSFDGHITVYSLLGGGHPIQPSNKVADSFGTADPFSQPQVHVPSLEQDKVMPLQKPPKWLRKPVGASFAFGGKLVSFIHEKAQNPQQVVPKQVHISQVITEGELLSRSEQLESALQKNQATEFCAMKAANSSDNMQENIWNFLLVNFESEPRTKFLQLLGYDKNELARKVEEHIGADGSLAQSRGIDATELAEKMSMLNASDSLKAGALNAGGQASPSVGSKTPGSRDELSDGSAAFDEIASSQNTGIQTPLAIPSDNDADGLMTQALLSGNFEAAVEMCLSENKMAEAILLAIAGGPELLTRTQKKYFQKNKSNLGRLISSIVTHDWSHIIQTCELDNWKEALAIILTYSSADEFANLCDSLAHRLESEKDGELSLYASLCYICSGNVEKLVENWVRNTENSNAPLALQDLVEKVMILRKAVEMSRGQAPDIPSGYLSDRLSHYAGLLAAQGSIFTAIGYLRNTNESSLIALQDRLFKAFGQAVPGIQTPQFPFPRVDVQPEGAKAQPQVQSHVAQGQKPVQLHQAQARGNVQTTTTPSVNYYNPSAYQGKIAPMNGPTTPTYTPGPVVSSAAPSHKGGLPHKYPSYPQVSAAYGLETYNQQPPYMQPEYNSMNHMGEPYGAPTSQMGSAPQQGIYNPTSTPGGPYVPQQSPAMNPSHPVMPSYQDVRAETAWNDPPLISKKNPTVTYDQQAAITSPIYGASQPNEQVPPGAPMNLYNPQEHQPPPQPAAPAPEPPKPVEKGPVPPDHQILQEIFNGLVKNCSQVATNAQMKRKLEDVSRKLELLYDRLRESSLSSSVLVGLHQIIQAIQQYDYTSSLSVYTQLVSQGNFSEISSFMPGIKVLLQSAAQMQVYVK